YIEIAKLGLRSDDARQRAAVRATLYYALERALLLLHPIMPYVTEEIWSFLPVRLRNGRDLLAAASWPKPGPTDLEAGALRKRIGDELAGAREQLTRLEQLLENPGFVARARPDVVERERARLTETRDRVQKLDEQVAALG